MIKLRAGSRLTESHVLVEDFRPDTDLHLRDPESWYRHAAFDQKPPSILNLPVVRLDSFLTLTEL
jgi:hypothetical protein